jgi:integrase
MIKVNFNLVENSSQPGNFFIGVSITLKSGKWRRLTGIKLKKRSGWNKKTKRVFPHVDDSDYINTRLEKIYLNLKSALMANDHASALDLDNALSGNTTTSKLSFLDFCQQFYEVRKASGRYSLGILKVYKVINNLFFEYQIHKGTVLTFKDLSRELLTDFQRFLTKDKGHSHNTISRTFKTLSTVCNEAKKLGYQVRDDYKSFSIPEKLTPKIYLTLEELHALNNASYPENIRQAVDIFLVCAFTGLRIGNFKYLNPDSLQTIRGVEMISYHQIKGDEQHIIPVHPIVRSILLKYGGFPVRLAEQTINEKIKMAAKIAGIDKPITLVSDIGCRKVVKIVTKYSLITNHTARRSCATNMHIMGVDHALIKKMTGHKTEKNLLKYIRIDSEDSAMLLADTAFFK